MIKLYRFFTRRPDMTHDEAVADWTGRHVPVVIDALGDRLLRYATNVAQPVSWFGEPPEAPPYDGFDELWLDVPWESSKGAGAAVAMREVVRGLFDAAPQLVESERRFAGLTLPMAAEELTQKETGRPHAFKLVELLVRAREMTWEQTREVWLRDHVPFVRDTWGDAIVHYTTNLGLTNPFTQRFPAEAPPYDGVAEIYWDLTPEAFVQGLLDTAAVMIPDETAFLGTYRGMLVEETFHR
jgi:hypothetical protein